MCSLLVASFEVAVMCEGIKVDYSELNRMVVMTPTLFVYKERLKRREDGAAYR